MKKNTLILVIIGASIGFLGLIFKLSLIYTASLFFIISIIFFTVSYFLNNKKRKTESKNEKVKAVVYDLEKMSAEIRIPILEIKKNLKLPFTMEEVKKNDSLDELNKLFQLCSDAETEAFCIEKANKLIMGKIEFVTNSETAGNLFSSTFWFPSKILEPIVSLLRSYLKKEIESSDIEVVKKAVKVAGSHSAYCYDLYAEGIKRLASFYEK